MSPIRVLLVEDEKALLSLLERHLQRAGFSVVSCLSAELALEAVESKDWQPDLLIADESLPGESGTILATRLMQRFPALVSLLCSGYPLSLESLPSALRQRAAILQKPYLPAMLQDAISELLADSRR